MEVALHWFLHPIITDVKTVSVNHSDSSKARAFYALSYYQPIKFFTVFASTSASLASPIYNLRNTDSERKCGKNPCVVHAPGARNDVTNRNINVKKILAVINATNAVAKRKPEKIRLAGIRTLTSAIPVQRSNQLS